MRATDHMSHYQMEHVIELLESKLEELEQQVEIGRQALQKAIDAWEGGPGSFERTGDILEAAITQLEGGGEK